MFSLISVNMINYVYPGGHDHSGHHDEVSCSNISTTTANPTDFGALMNASNLTIL